MLKRRNWKSNNLKSCIWCFFLKKKKNRDDFAADPRERVCVCVRENKKVRECVWVRDREWERESVSVPVLEKFSVSVESWDDGSGVDHDDGDVDGEYEIFWHRKDARIRGSKKRRRVVLLLLWKIPSLFLITCRHRSTLKPKGPVSSSQLRST